MPFAATAGCTLKSALLSFETMKSRVCFSLAGPALMAVAHAGHRLRPGVLEDCLVGALGEARCVVDGVDGDGDRGGCSRIRGAVVRAVGEVSEPLKFAGGVYVNEPSALSVTVPPFADGPTGRVVSELFSASVSLVRTPVAAGAVSATSSLVLYESLLATGGVLPVTVKVNVFTWLPAEHGPELLVLQMTTVHVPPNAGAKESTKLELFAALLTRLSRAGVPTGDAFGGTH